MIEVMSLHVLVKSQVLNPDFTSKSPEEIKQFSDPIQEVLIQNIKGKTDHHYF